MYAHLDHFRGHLVLTEPPAHTGSHQVPLAGGLLHRRGEEVQLGLEGVEQGLEAAFQGRGQEDGLALEKRESYQHKKSFDILIKRRK